MNYNVESDEVLSNVIASVTKSLSDYNDAYGALSKSETVRDILNAVRPTANWVKRPKGKWCFVYACSRCDEGEVPEMRDFCPDCGALMTRGDL